MHLHNIEISGDPANFLQGSNISKVNVETILLHDCETWLGIIEFSDKKLVIYQPQSSYLTSNYIEDAPNLTIN